MFRNIALEDIPVEPCAMEITHYLKAKGYTTKIVTARGYHDNARQRTLNWCQTHNLAIDDVIVVPLYGAKREVLKQLGQIDLYVEDNHDHVEAAHDLTNVGRVFLMNRPWNLNCNVGTRVNELREVFQILTHQ
jgi:uncharacterized HAD superfamily protein